MTRRSTFGTVAALSLMALASPLAADSAPSAMDETTLDRLANNRGLTLQWISWDQRGTVQARRGASGFYLTGSQVDPVKPGAVLVSTWWLGATAALNLLTFFTYALDKSAAQRGTWRTRESHLHLLALLGGWPAAWWAQQWLRHKSRKQDFRAVYWGTVVLNCAALAVWTLRPQTLREVLSFL